MIDAKTKTTERRISLNKPLMVAIILVISFALGLYGYNAFRAFQSPQPGHFKITQSTLEEKYGLRVQLVAVTAAGGMADLRLQIADAERAKAFLYDRANFPALRLENGVVLRSAEDIASQEIQFENGKMIFILFPNAGNSLKPGDPVNIVWGDLQLEPIQAK
jgi:hypothetical protein